MQLILKFARAYPLRSLIALLALIVAGLAEGIGLTTLLPLLSLAIDQPGPARGEGLESDASFIDTLVEQVLGFFNLSPTIGTLLLIVLAGLFIKTMLVLLAQRQVGYTVAHVATDMRLELIHALMGSRWEYFLRQPVGALANSVATEANRASSAYLHGANMTAFTIQMLVYMTVAMLISWQATLIALTAGSAFFFLLGGLVRSARKAGRRQTRVLKSLLGRFTDSLSSVKPLKAMGREKPASAFLRDETRQLNKALRRQVFSKQALKALQELLVGMLILGGFYVALEIYGVELSAVLVLTLLMARLLGQMTKVQQQYQEMMICKSAYNSIQMAISEASAAIEPVMGQRRVELRKQIQLDSVSFAYRRDDWVLRDLSLTIPAGVMTTLTGASGGGKTTVVDLIIGLLRPQHGEVLIDGVPLAEIDIHAWRHSIGYVPQDTFLLHDTVFNNLTLGESEFTQQQAEAALRAAGIFELVESLPEGMHTVVGERGSMFSGGQRQRVAIARALIHRPALLILDEATSALDPHTEAAICNTLQGLRGQLTIIAISHQDALVDSADCVYSLREGQARLLRSTVADDSGKVAQDS